MTRRIITRPAAGLVLTMLAPALIAACSHAPLSDIKAVPGGTRDEVPRDGNGEPMLGAVRPVPSTAMPVTPKPVP